MTSALTDVNTVIEDCTIMVDAIENESIHKMWDTQCLGNWSSMIDALERIKSFIESKNVINNCPHCGTSELLCGHPTKCTSINN